MSSFELSPGVVVDTDRREAYVMSPEGEIVALDLAEGTALWRSQEAGKPLGLAGGFLIGQAETSGPANELSLVMLDTSKEGAPVSRSVVELPLGVQSAIEEGPNRSFVAHVAASAEDATVSWEFIQRPLRGVPPGPLEVLPGEAPPETAAVTAASEMAPATEPGADAMVDRGAVRLSLTDGTVTQVEPDLAEFAPAAPSASKSARAADLTPETRLPGVPEPQFLSADGHHVMSSQRVADAAEWDKYLWMIYDRATGDLVGEARTHVRYTPFFVAGSRLILQLSPFTRRTGSGLQAEPLQVRALDLRTGERVWSQPVRDTIDREPPPP